MSSGNIPLNSSTAECCLQHLIVHIRQHISHSSTNFQKTISVEKYCLWHWDKSNMLHI